MRPGDQLGQLGLVHPLDRHGVELNRQPGILRRGDPLEHLRQRIAAGQLRKPSRIERVERDVDSPHPGFSQLRGMARQLGTIGGQRHLVEPFADMAAQHADEVDHVAAD